MRVITHSEAVYLNINTPLPSTDGTGKVWLQHALVEDMFCQVLFVQFG